MTVPSSTAKSGPYLCNGVTDVFNYGFRIVDKSHLNVILADADGAETTLDLTTHYTVSDVGEDTGSINLTAAGVALAVTGTTLTILRNPPFTQETDLQNQGAYLAQTVEDRFDLLTMQIQTVKERSDRSIAVSASDDGTTLGELTADLIRLADSADSIDTVAGIETEVTIVAGIAADVTTVAGVASGIPAVADVADDIPTVAAIAADIPTIADNIEDVNTFSKVYLGAKASAPTTRNDGSALEAGDQYFDTTTDKLKIYTGSAWVGGTGDLVSTANLSDVSDKAAALGNLGGMALATYDPNSVGKDIFARAFRWSFRDFGAVGDGVTDDTAAVNAALAAGVPLTGAKKSYAVSGNILLPANADLEDAEFLQLDAAGSINRRTLTTSSVDGIRLVRVKVDRNGDGAGGGDSTGNAAGIWIQGGAKHYMEDCEVTGDDCGSGITISGAHDFTVVRPYVHDIKYALASDPGDDRVQGVYFSSCYNFTVIDPRIDDLGGVFAGGAYDVIYSRALAIGLGCYSFCVLGGRIQRVDQGVDLTGSNGSYAFSIIGTEVIDAATWGFKASNFTRFGSFVGCTSLRAGSAGFVVSASGGDIGAPTNQEPRHSNFIDCYALDTGYANTGRGTSAPTGFLVLQNAIRPSYPRGVRFENCRAIDNQDVKTQQYGFKNEIPFTAGAPANQCINCVAEGLVSGGAKFSGFHTPAVLATYPSSVSIASGSYQPLNFTAETYDTMLMHDNAASQNMFTIQEEGWYDIHLKVEFGASSAGTRKVQALINGGSDGTEVVQPAPATGTITLQLFHTRYLYVSDTVRFEGYQDSGADLGVRVNSKAIIKKSMQYN